MKLIAVQGCTIKVEPEKGTLATSVITSTASSDVSVNGKQAYKDKITVTIPTGTVLTLAEVPAGASANVSTPLAIPVNIDIEGTPEKATTDIEPFVLEGDEGKEDITFLFPPSTGSTPIQVKISVKVSVDDTGQNVVNVT